MRRIHAAIKLLFEEMVNEGVRPRDAGAMLFSAVSFIQAQMILRTGVRKWHNHRKEVSE